MTGFGPATLVLLACLATAAESSWTDYLRDKMLRFLDSGPQRTKRETGQGTNALVKFENCGEDDDTFLVHYVNVLPNPVTFPGEMNVTFSMDVKEDVFPPIKGEMTMMKKLSLLFGLESWFDIPCLDQKIGSCTFDDICDNEVFREGLCKTFEDGKEVCGCPFLKGNYTSKPVTYKVPAFPEDLPVYLLRGEFLVKAVLTKGEQHLACYQASFFLEV